MPAPSKGIARSRKVTLPSFVRSVICSADDPGATARHIPGGDGRSPLTYYYRQAALNEKDAESDVNVEERYNLFPVVLDRDGCPWEPSVAYIVEELQSEAYPNMLTYHGIADDLAYFLDFLQETGIDYADFPANKLKRPTYRFRGKLKVRIRDRETAASTAKRRMGTVISFYRWLVDEKLLTPSHPPWQERDVYLSLKDARGSTFLIKKKLTDVSIQAPKQDDAFSEHINDGGRLRPLTAEEQAWVITALSNLKNTEMTLIHEFMILTGARIQTALTLRVRHFETEVFGPLNYIRLAIGPGSGIDTKKDKRMTLHLPLSLFNRLRIYVTSERARSRRLRAPGGDSPDQYAFLTQQGSPYYEPKETTTKYDPLFALRHRKRGQTVRMFIREHVLPYIRTNFSRDFHYQIHDLRASYGMNMSDRLLLLVERGEITLSRAREILATRMGHQSIETTDRYLDYRRNLAAVHSAVDEHEQYVSHLIRMAWDGTIYGTENP